VRDLRQTGVGNVLQTTEDEMNEGVALSRPALFQDQYPAIFRVIRVPTCRGGVEPAALVTWR
jgi:hypothetical protein